MGKESRWSGRVVLLVLTMGLQGMAYGATPGESLTASDPSIPTDQLEAILRPLEVEDLIVEAEAWQELVKAKVRDIAFAEVAVKRRNVEIKKAEVIAEKAEEAKAATDEADRAMKEAAQAGDATAVREASDKAREAELASRELEKAVAESETQAVDTEASAKIDEAINNAAQKAQEKAQQEVQDAVTESTGQLTAETAAEIADAAQKIDQATAADNKLKEAAEAAQSVASGGSADTEDLTAITEVAQEAVEGKEEEKTQLLESINVLREERTALIDRFGIVLTELEAKGGDPDSYWQYVVAVTGLKIDWWDIKSTWLSLSGWFKSEEGGLRWVKNILFFVLIVIGFWVLSRLAGVLTKKSMYFSKSFSSRMSSLVQEFVVTMAHRLVLGIGFVVALSALELDLGPILAVIGAAGFVIAFALQDSLSNFASGIMILLYRPFDVDDVVEVADVSGKVRSLSLVSTTINTFDNKLVIVPNNSVWGNVITNATASRVRRVDMVFGIGYADDMGKAQSILEDVAASHEKVLKTPETVVRVHELADSSVNYICRPWVKSEDYWEVYWDVTRTVKERFDAEGVSIPFPQRDVHVYTEGATVEPSPVPQGGAA